MLIVAAILVGCVFLLSDNADGISWEQKDSRKSIAIVSGVLDSRNVPTNFTYYDDTVPLDTALEDIVDVAAPRRGKTDGRVVVGFSQMEVNNSWRIHENISMLKSAQDYNIEIVYKDAESSLEKQLSDIRELIEQDVDYIVIAPRKYYGYKEVLQEAKEAGIPVILLDRSVDGVAGEDYLTCIMCDFITIGQEAGNLIYNLFGEKELTILEVSGTADSSVAVDLDKGFRSVADKHGWNIIKVDGDFDQKGSLQPLEEAFITYGHEIDAVFTHIDDSALSAIKVMKYAEITPGADIENGEIPIVSMGGYKDALKAIAAGKIYATIECNPRLGFVVFHNIYRLANDYSIKSRITIPSKIYTIDNIEKYLYTEGY